MTIATFNSKGGTGKTTTSVTLARYWNHYEPILYDLDPQNAVPRYAKGLEGVQILTAKASDFYSGKMQDGPLRIIDCPPDFRAAQPALEVADLVILPFVAEYAVTQELLLAKKSIESMKNAPAFRVLLSRYNARDEMAVEIRKAIQNAFGELMFQTIIPDEKNIRHAPKIQGTVLDFAPISRGASAFRALAKEIEKMEVFAGVRNA